MVYKLRTQPARRFGCDLPAEIAYNIHLYIDNDSAPDLARGLVKAYTQGERSYEVPHKYVVGGENDTFLRVILTLQDDWFEPTSMFEPTEYQWYGINVVDTCIFKDDDTILIRNTAGKIEVAKSVEEVLNCNRAVIAQFLVIHCEVPF